MLRRIFAALLTAAAMGCLAHAASAQYMYLDSNGNGVPDSGDKLNANGTATTVNVYIRTNMNRDGSTPTCNADPASPLSFNSYVVNLHASGGTVTYSGFINRQTTFNTGFGELNAGAGNYKNGFGQQTTLTPVQYQMCTLTITGQTGSPRIDIIDEITGSADVTSFGGACPGSDFDNTYKLIGPTGIGHDWTDVDGLAAAAGVVNNPPVVTNPGNQTVNELTPLAFTVVATDPDAGQTLTYSLTPGAPTGATINATTGGFSWTPTEAQGPGVYPATVTATDNGTPLMSASAAFTITVNEVNTAPVLGPIGNKSATIGTPVTFTATATDADIPANTLTFSLDADAPPGATIGASTGAFSWTPSACGTFPVTVRVTDNGTPPLSAFEAISIALGCSNQPPVVSNPGNKTVNELTNLAFTVTATDPNAGDLITWSLALGTPAASGATINASTGAFNWTPTEVQGPGFYPVTIVATDNGTPVLSGSAAITIMVNEVNTAPAVTNPGDKTVNELVNLAFTATATDADIPANTIIWSLTLGTPAATGATIGASTGAFSWTPTEAQGPGTYPVTVAATDNGSPAMQDTAAITVTVNEVNSAPVLAPIGNKSGTVGVLVAFSATATDADLPANVLRFSLDAGAPAGATISSSGSFAWTPACGQNGTFPVTIRVTDNGVPPLSDFEGITIAVNAAGNPPPVLATIGNKTVNEGSLLSFTATATDPDAGAVLTFSLDPGAPIGAGINGTSGVFAWTPAEAQGPGSFTITVRVTDNGACPATDFESITITVNEVNSAPVLAPIGNKAAACPGVTLTFTATATDSDVPANVLTFSLDAGAPAGATINASTGAFSWTPTATGTFPVTIRVTDNGTPALSAFEAISITTGAGCQPPPVVSNPGNKTVNELTNLAFTVTATDPNPGAVLTWSLTLGARAATGATINASTGAFSWTPTETQGPGVYPVTIVATDNASPPLSGAAGITITVNEVNSAPVLAPIGNKSACGPGEAVTFTVTATDTDIPANVLTFSLDAGVPAGATINASTGAFSWTPSTGGNFPVTVRVTDNGTPPLSDFEVITIVVPLGGPNPLVLGAIGNKTVDEQTLLAFTATATDLNQGVVITFSLTLGSPAATGAAINASTGAFSWTPTEAQGPGVYPVTITATDNGTPPCPGTDSRAITITVNEVNSAPVLAPIGNKTVDAGTLLVFTATATDPDIPPNVLTFSLDAGAPVGATIAGTTGAFSWAPSFAQIGVFPITVRVTDNGMPPLSDLETISVQVNLVDHPTADAGGPYSGIVNFPVNFNGTGSSDPAGAVLTYDWTFGDGATGVGVTPSHAYSAAGTYQVTLRVTNPGGLYDDDGTTAMILDGGARPQILLESGGSTIDARKTGNRTTKVGLEETLLPYTDLIPSSVRLSTTFPNSGFVTECPPDLKSFAIGDLNGNGIPDLDIRFANMCLANLFNNVPDNSVQTVVMTGLFSTSGVTVPLNAQRDLTIRVKHRDQPIMAVAYPNPFNPETVISYTVMNSGSVSLKIYAVDGRLVRTLKQGEETAAGTYEVTWNGTDDTGRHVSSGIYLLKTTQTAGATVKSSVLKLVVTK